MSVVETRISLWEALAGRVPGVPTGPADAGVWTAVADRINPAKARPVLRAGIEESNLVSARGVPYTMLRSPDPRAACYLRLTPAEVELARLMDGSRTLARLVAEFARISGRLAPDQVRRVVADLAGNRMLEELPLDVFRPLRRIRRRPWPVRFGRVLLAFVQGRRVVLANVDPLVGLLYKAGGRLLFTRVAASLLGVVAVVGLVSFGWQWWAGAQSVFLTSDSYAIGAAVLLGLNIVALACHEVGHALAAKHAGRRVPSAGFLVYFGIPSVFVDTTDVWMAGRRARLLTTASGPAAGLVLAGASALVGLAVPEAAPWCFKLSFAWYVNALFNLNPFLALDGYYLLMDWLELPNLRARGLAWVIARIRRRPPTWRMLDREGRLVALYGCLALAWIAIALNIGYRVYVDRVAGLTVGLWRSGWAAHVLLVAVVGALASPVVYLAAGFVARRGRRLRLRLVQRRVWTDLPRRIDALRASALRDLPATTLSGLAGRARWLHPRTGGQLVFGGAAQSNVYVVIDGALEGRAADDPVGTVRERVGAGGVVGLAQALTGAASPLDWYSAGTILLAVPSSAVAAVLGPAAGGLANAHGSTGEAEAALVASPGLAGMSGDDILGLATVAIPIWLAAGSSIVLNGPDDVLVIASGVIALPDGRELGAGTMIGPSGVERPPPIAVARTPVRMFRVPAASGLPLLVGATAGSGDSPAPARAGRAPVSGAHPHVTYPPLTIPPGPPPSNVDDKQDGRFERRLGWLLVLALLLALVFTGANIAASGLAWAEMPSDKALLHADHGPTSAVVNGQTIGLDEGQDVYIGESDSVSVPPRSRATVTYHGGAVSVLCAGTRVSMGPLSSAGHPVAPAARFSLTVGLAVTDTGSTSPAFEPLAASVDLPGGAVVNDGAAWFAASTAGVNLSSGKATYAGSALTETRERLGCGDGTYIARPVIPRATTSAPDETTAALTPAPTLTMTPTATPRRTTPTTTRTTTTTRPPQPTSDFTGSLGLFQGSTHSRAIDRRGGVADVKATKVALSNACPTIIIG